MVSESSQSESLTLNPNPLNPSTLDPKPYPWTRRTPGSGQMFETTVHMLTIQALAGS